MLWRMAVSVRNFRDDDFDAVLRLVQQDVVPHQPVCTPQMLSDALAGRSPVDTGWWRQLTRLENLVAVDGRSVVGAAAIGLSADGNGYVLWLHAAERHRVVSGLLDEASTRLAGRVAALRGFWFATSLTLGLEGLPADQRPETHAALLERGFTGRDCWLYMAGSTAAAAERLAGVSPLSNPPGWKLTLRKDNTAVADARIGLGFEGVRAPGVGVVWWISVEDPFRRRGLGGKLLD
jgi:hypothetical protein